jgi:hypothetical protein
MTAVRLVAIAAIWLLVFTSLDGAEAQDAPTIVDIAVQPRIATVGDRLDLTIRVAHSDTFSVSGPGFGDNFGTLELLDVAEPQISRAGPGTSITTLGFTLTSFATGAHELPPLPVRWTSGAGEGVLETDTATVIIESVLSPGDTELRPLKAQLEIDDAAPSPLVPAVYVATFAVLTALGYVLVARAIGGRPREAAFEPAPIPLTPAERARAALDALSVGDRRDLRAYYADIAATVRRYLSERYAFPAYAMTRRELQRHMSRSGLDRWPARLTGNLLEQSDAVQFAGFEPASERADADLTAAYEIIELTQVDEAEPESGEEPQPPA